MQKLLSFATSSAAIFFMLLIFSSCGSSNTPEDTESLDASLDSDIEMASMVKNQTINEDVPKFNDVSDKTRKHVNTLIMHYDTVKNALVQSDYLKTQNKINGLIEEIVSFNNKKDLKDEQAGFYLKVGAKLKNNAERIKKSNSLEEQRSHFSSLTADLIKIVKAFGGNEGTVYYQFCPMAFDNTGGFWLSLNKQIQNPYFGDKMMKCGMVRETIK